MTEKRPIINAESRWSFFLENKNEQKSIGNYTLRLAKMINDEKLSGCEKINEKRKNRIGIVFYLPGKAMIFLMNI